MIVTTVAADEASALEPIPELAAPPRRKRLLSEEERALWESVARQTKPLRKKSRAVKPPPASAHPEPLAVKTAAPPKQLASAKMARQPGSEPPPAPPLAPIGRRERAQLSRGRKEIDARLDLHGMTQTRAHRALSDFLRRAHIDGLTFVLVITGKGSAAAAAFRARGVAPPGAAMAEPAGIPHPGGWFRGGAYRPWRRGRALCADQAGAMMSIRTAARFPPAGGW